MSIAVAITITCRRGVARGEDCASDACLEFQTSTRNSNTIQLRKCT